MALGRRQSNNHMIWPGFVDAVTTLLMVMIFILTIFTVMQSVLRQEITTKSNELSELNSQIAGLADALGLERRRAAELLEDSHRQADQIAHLSSQLGVSEARIVDFEKQLAGLLAERDAARAEVADLSQQNQSQAQQIDEQQRLHTADQSALAQMRDKLKSADDELTAMTLALEAQRKRAEETLTLLAGAEAARDRAVSTGDQKATALDNARKILSEKEEELVDQGRKLALLNQQIAALRSQLSSLQGLLDASAAKDGEARVQIDALGSKLNAALAQLAAEQKRRAEAEAAERERLAAENLDLERYRSEFFGQLSTLLANRPGVRVVGDRFVFSSEVLFATGSADLLPEGRAQIAEVAKTLGEISTEIPPQIDWIIRVDGHTDDQPLSGQGAYRDNWELSQARALSVVRYMQSTLGFPPERMAATGFGEYRPVAPGDSAEARAQNRRIELKLTER